jgi:glycosyltransferase involved in cell wall biosynthesis
VRWENDRYEAELLEPIRKELSRRRLRAAEIRYGGYREAEFQDLLGRVKAMVFICEHETQGLAYQEALSMGIPILAWDRGGDWRDPAYYPDRVRYGPVSSVPYWDARCGEKFGGVEEFRAALQVFWDRLTQGVYDPRSYILENLGLEKCASEYLRHWDAVDGGTVL